MASIGPNVKRIVVRLEAEDGTAEEIAIAPDDWSMETTRNIWRRSPEASDFGRLTDAVPGAGRLTLSVAFDAAREKQAHADGYIEPA